MDLNVYNINFMVGIFGRPSEITYFANMNKGIDTSGILIMDYISFKGSCIAAKDCKGPTSVVIQGDKGYIYSNETMNKASSFRIVLNDGTQIDRTFKDDKHRLYYEFNEFIHMVDDKNYEYAGEMLEKSVVISEIMEEARWEEKIIFSSNSKLADHQ